MAVVCDVQVSLIQGASLKVEVKIHKDGARGPRHSHIFGEVRLHKDQLGAQAPPNEARHGRAHPIFARHVCATKTSLATAKKVFAFSQLQRPAADKGVAQ